LPRLRNNADARARAVGYAGLLLAPLGYGKPENED
jgi:hypothetical protein